MSTGRFLLDVAGLSKLFGGLVAVDDLSFALAEGEILGLLGPNGSGKTTVFNLIGGSLRADAGRIRYAGVDITRHPPSVRTGLGIARTFQLVRPLPSLSALDNVLVARLYGRAGDGSMVEARAEGFALLHRVGLAEKAFEPAASLTLVEHKRLETARALATHPRVLLLDEPLGGLSAAEVGSTLALFREIRQEGVTLVIVEHNVHAVRTLCDRLIILNSGRSIAEGTPEAALSHPEVIEVYLGTKTTRAEPGLPPRRSASVE